MEKLDFTPENLKVARAKAGLSQQKLADKAEVSRDTIARYESGKNPNASRRTMIKISSVLKGYDIKLIHPWSCDIFDSSEVSDIMWKLASLEADDVTNLDAMSILISAIELFLDINDIDKKVAPTMAVKLSDMARSYKLSPELFNLIHEANDLEGMNKALKAIEEYMLTKE